jgi:L-lactate dehydrogenase complex protein LldG
MAPDSIMHVDLRKPFTHYAHTAGAQVLIVADVAAAALAIATLGDGLLRCTAATLDRYPDLAAALAANGRPAGVAEDVAVEIPDPTTLAATLAGGTGLVLARAGIAETGSVVLADDGLAPRLVSMLADTCVVLLAADTLLPALDDAARVLDDLNRAGHRYISLVSGPSRTADIERVLTIGVQGPKALYILIIGGEGSATHEQAAR